MVARPRMRTSRHMLQRNEMVAYPCTRVNKYILQRKEMVAYPRLKVSSHMLCRDGAVVSDEEGVPWEQSNTWYHPLERDYFLFHPNHVDHNNDLIPGVDMDKEALSYFNRQNRLTYRYMTRRRKKVEDYPDFTPDELLGYALVWMQATCSKLHHLTKFTKGRPVYSYYKQGAYTRHCAGIGEPIIKCLYLLYPKYRHSDVYNLVTSDSFSEQCPHFPGLTKYIENRLDVNLFYEAIDWLLESPDGDDE